VLKLGLSRGIPHAEAAEAAEVAEVAEQRHYKKRKFWPYK